MVDGSEHYPDHTSWFTERFVEIGTNIARVIQGKSDVIDLMVTAMIAEGHILIEDVPGVGKTQLAKSLARSIDGTFHRIQFTPDLLPADLTGVSIWDRQRGKFVFRRGPIFANVVVGDEINRASPKTQAAMLEAMAEKQVTVDGITRELPPPFLVVATQNPIEHEGTYPLPEAQLDRFLMRITVGYPTRDSELEMLDAHAVTSSFDDLEPVIGAADVVKMIGIARGIHVSVPVREYLIDLIEATRSHPEVLLGASPRASLALQRAARARAASRGREFVQPDDLKDLAIPILAHRMALRPEAVMRGATVAATLADIISSVPVRAAH
ncbi:MAG: AAA family ATPase [Acidimicrobiia bacterium]|nr:AAA family ATPase [Acidimicrobiia bacterium]NND12871.1 AAA family ATPase [Acidimicrobiia bacterium]NNL48935.1 AAA family ATPase [Acidimicrobiia bacterium]